MNYLAKEITPEELDRLDRGSYRLIDVREEEDFQSGKLPDAVHVDLLAISNETHQIPKDKKLIVYCKYGTLSLPAAETLCEQGYEAYSLSGGYGKWLLRQIQRDMESEERRADIEKSIRKKFKKTLFTPFAKAINDYEMIKEGDNIAICISGGKDSMIMAKLFQELKRHNKFQFDLTFLCMDPGYNEDNRRIIEKNAELLGIPLVFFQTDIFDAVYDIPNSPCYVCARMRRGHLYHKAKELGCNKIALGHHFDDVIETTLMGMLYSGQFQSMMPKLHSTNFEGMELIRPLYYIREDDIKHWRDYNHLNFIQCACKFTDTCTTCHTDGTTSSKRLETKKLIQELKKTNPFVEKNIFRSTENVSLNTILGIKKDGVKHSFLEWYENGFTSVSQTSVNSAPQNIAASPQCHPTLSTSPERP